MSRRSHPLWLALLLLALAPAARAMPQESLAPEQRRALETLALADARTRLYDEIARLPLEHGRTLADWLAREPSADRALRLWVRQQPRHGVPRIYQDGVCECDLMIPATAIETQLVAWIDTAPATAQEVGLDPAALHRAAQRWETLWLTGHASPTGGLSVVRPIGWENVTAEGMELARRAAIADACAALLADAGQLQVTPAHKLQEFLDHGPAIREAVADGLKRAADIKVTYEADQIAAAEATLAMRDLLRTLTRAHQEHYRGDAFAAADFREMTLLAGRDALRSTGLAAPPGPTVRRSAAAPLELDAPAWADEQRQATGRYVPQEFPPPPPDRVAALARIDALVRLQHEILALEIRAGVSIGRFVTYYQDLKEDIVLFISGAHPVGGARPLADGGAELTVEIPLRRLWEIVRRKMELVETDPEATPADRPGEERSAP